MASRSSSRIERRALHMIRSYYNALNFTSLSEYGYHRVEFQLLNKRLTKATEVISCRYQIPHSSRLRSLRAMQPRFEFPLFVD